MGGVGHAASGGLRGGTSWANEAPHAHKIAEYSIEIVRFFMTFAKFALP